MKIIIIIIISELDCISNGEANANKNRTWTYVSICMINNLKFRNTFGFDVLNHANALLLYYICLGNKR